MFKDQMQQDVIMVLKFPSNSPVTHVAANTLPHLTLPAIVTITCSRLFAVNRWHNTVGEWECLCVLTNKLLAWFQPTNQQKNQLQSTCYHLAMCEQHYPTSRSPIAPLTCGSEVGRGLSQRLLSPHTSPAVTATHSDVRTKRGNLALSHY